MAARLLQDRKTKARPEAEKKNSTMMLLSLFISTRSWFAISMQISSPSKPREGSGSALAFTHKKTSGRVTARVCFEPARVWYEAHMQHGHGLLHPSPLAPAQNDPLIRLLNMCSDHSPAGVDPAHSSCMIRRCSVLVDARNTKRGH